MKLNEEIEQFRTRHPLLPPTKKGDSNGWFEIPRSHKYGPLNILFSSGGSVVDWEHASVAVSPTNIKPPNWEQMCFVKSMFWGEDEAVMQFHPPKTAYVNNHPGCLHLWKKKNHEFELPPSIAVGIKNKIRSEILGVS